MENGITANKAPIFLLVIFRFAGQEHIDKKCQAESDQTKTDKNHIIQNMTSKLISDGCT